MYWTPGTACRRGPLETGREGTLPVPCQQYFDALAMANYHGVPALDCQMDLSSPPSGAVQLSKGARHIAGSFIPQAGLHSQLSFGDQQLKDATNILLLSCTSHKVDGPHTAVEAPTVLPKLSEC